MILLLLIHLRNHPVKWLRTVTRGESGWNGHCARNCVAQLRVEHKAKHFRLPHGDFF